MIDYLEEALDNARELLEQVKRLEGRRAFGPETAGAAELEAATGAAAWGEAQGRRETAGAPGLPDPEGRTPPEAGQVEPGPSPEGGAPEEARRAPAPLEEGASALLKQLETLERQTAPPAAPGPGRDGIAGPLPPGGGAVSPRTAAAPWNAAFGPAEDRDAGSALIWNGVWPAESLRWVEQADRAFRRDSRRYDGSFYLY